MSASSEIRKALLAGEKLANADMESFGVGITVLSQLRSKMKNEGHKFAKERIDGINYWYITNIKSSTPDEPERAIILPTLLDSLEVAALAVDRKGRLGMTLRNNKHSWRVIIEGVASK